MRVTSKYLLTKHVIIHHDNEREYDIRFALIKLDKGSVERIRECTEFMQNPHVNKISTNLLTCDVVFIDSGRNEDEAYWVEVFLGEEEQIEILKEQFDKWSLWLGVYTVNHEIRIYDNDFLFYADMKHSDIELETKLFNLKDFD
jgi:ABC-type sulfate/molybdate transport systems ATPase subunit